MRNKHITRNYDANRVHTIRPSDEDFRLEILKYDKTFEQFYTPLATTGISKDSNIKKMNFDGMAVYHSVQGTMKLEFTYNASETSENYRLELLYLNTYRLGYSKTRSHSNRAKITIAVNDKKVLSAKELIANDVTYNRHYQYVKLEQGENKITYWFTPSMAFIGLAVKKYDIYTAHRDSRNSDKITMISNEVEKTSDFSINTMKCELMYYHGLDEKLKPTDPKANPSGLLFDYRDEINYYVKNNQGKSVRVFGGYISTIDVDNDLTKVTLNCADRMIDLDHRYCLSELMLNGQTTDSNISYNDSLDYVRNFNYYSNGIKFLLNHCEVPVKSNLLISDPLVEKKTKTLVDYGEKKQKLGNVSNVKTHYAKNYVTLRNNSDVDKAQSVVLFDSSKKPVALNSYPNLWIQYGMGKAVWEEKVYETTTTESSGIASSVKKQADKICPNMTGSVCVKPLWEWICTHIKHNKNRGGFYQEPSTTLSTKEGNCCCKSELLLDWCNYKGVTNLKYVHVTKSPTVGHVFTKINGRYVDPSSRAVGWGGFVKGYGALGSGKTTNYPTKPF